MSAHQQIVMGVILARGGSKGIPRKNINPLAGVPLIAHTIFAARDAKSLHRTIVSTDDEEIAEIARNYGAEVPFLRPAGLAEDDTPDLPVFQHALRWLEKHEGYRPDILVHLRPTYPLRMVEDIDAAVSLLMESDADSVKSVREVKEHPHKMWELEGNRLVPYLKTEFRRQVGPDYPRQKLEPLYISKGVVDVVRSEVVEAGSMTGDDVRPYFVDPVRTIDIDTPLDLQIAEALITELDFWKGQQ